MFLSVDEIGADARPVDRIVEVEPLAGPDGRALPLGSARVHGSLRRVAGGHEFRGRVETSVELGCSRCLERFRTTLDLPFDLIYGRAPEPEPAGEAGELEPEGPEYMPLDEGRIDLARLVTEQVYLALPLKPLCSGDCPGLCPRCGASRRREACGCAVEVADPRWSALEEIKKRLERS